MEKNSKSKGDPNPRTESFSKLLQTYGEEGSIPEKYQRIIREFYDAYVKTLGAASPELDSLFTTYVKLIRDQCIEPYPFQPYHVRIRTPFDYYHFGIDMMRPLVDLNTSSLEGTENLKEISQAVEKGDNVILLANHQVEADPQAISILLEKDFASLAEKMIFVAGERVITDPLAVPFSLGCNLLCIYSKRYIDYPPDQKLKKQLHNKKTMQLMSELLSEGGKVIYVAPSGGRDRPNAQGVVEVARFDPQSIEMFYLMAQRAGHPTHFYPLSLYTYELLPPPETIQVELGESRTAKRAGIHLCFGKKIDMEHFSASELKDKHARREARASAIWDLVVHNYSRFFKRS